jgi:MFS family permease
MYRIFAEVVMYVHLAYICGVVFGQLAILIGIVCGWRWIRNPWFRVIHLIMIAIPTYETIQNVDCPLMTLEDHLRREAGQPSLEEGSFVARWLGYMQVNMPEWAYTPMFIGLGIMVAVTFVLAPPRRNRPESVPIPQPSS